MRVLSNWIGVNSIIMKNYDKLVRDKIPASIKANGENCLYHQADDEEFQVKLRLKLQEEVSEYLAMESIEEMADILEVIDTIVENQGWGMEAVKQAQVEKREKRGGFQERFVLDQS
jgi:predicted house-cleaning noncanonical NTP pyrophosphatase (MazG superfamily)